MPSVNSQTPNREHRPNASERRVAMTGLCLNYGNRVTFCWRPFTADVRYNKCKYINSFKETYQPVEC